jgi:hypothetical protein
MQQPAGITLLPDGSLLVCVQAGANAHSVARFDANGNFLGNLIAPGAGGVDFPVDVMRRTNGNILVAATGSERIHEFDATGAFIADFASVDQGVWQLTQAENGNVLVASGEFRLRGVLELDPAGTTLAQLAPAGLTDFSGVAELPNGDLVVSVETRHVTGGNDGNADGGLFIMDRVGNLLSRKISGFAPQHLKLAIQDSDGDGAGDTLDGCPDDPDKSAAGQCGCGNADTDSDGDGTADCVDGCPADASKTAPGACGCSNPETDGDADGTPDCVDGCPADPNKTDAGACGCGNADVDSDGDAIPDCNDGCSNDPNKTSPGTCGCGVADTDRDGDGTPDCNDQCPDDPAKFAPGTCGCGAADEDVNENGIADCLEEDLDDDVGAAAPCGSCGAGLSPLVLVGMIVFRAAHGRRRSARQDPRAGPQGYGPH